MPSSPKLQNTIYDNTSNNSSAGQPPISPHVNVPNTLQPQQKVFVQPPPLPPRRERKESSAVLLAQTKQTPDAPQVNSFIDYYMENLCIFFIVFIFSIIVTTT